MTGFGFSRSIHRIAVGNSLVFAKAMRQEAIQRLRQGNCGLALIYLIRASSSADAAWANAIGTGEIAARRRAQAERSKTDSLRRAFSKHCIVARRGRIS